MKRGAKKASMAPYALVNAEDRPRCCCCCSSSTDFCAAGFSGYADGFRMLAILSTMLAILSTACCTRPTVALARCFEQVRCLCMSVTAACGCCPSTKLFGAGQAEIRSKGLQTASATRAQLGAHLSKKVSPLLLLLLLSDLLVLAHRLSLRRTPMGQTLVPAHCCTLETLGISASLASSIGWSFKTVWRWLLPAWLGWFC